LPYIYKLINLIKMKPSADRKKIEVYLVEGVEGRLN
jgi:hypothetical protein